jgi:hypothetical protein
MVLHPGRKALFAVLLEDEFVVWESNDIKLKLLLKQNGQPSSKGGNGDWSATVVP